MGSLIVGIIVLTGLYFNEIAPQYFTYPVFPIDEHYYLYGLLVWVILKGGWEVLKKKEVDEQRTLPQESPKVDEAPQLREEVSTLSRQLREVLSQKSALEEQITTLESRKQPERTSQEPLKGYAFLLLSLLQEKGRLLDFVLQDISQYSDEEVGGVARFVHQGCKAVVEEHFAPEPLRSEEEGSKVSLQEVPSARELKLLGTPPEVPPFQGTLLHRGWKATKFVLPEIKQEAFESIITPAELECREK